MKEQWKWGTDNDYWVRSCAWSAPGCHPVGCGVKLHVVDNKLVGIEGDEEHPVTNGRLCVRCLTLPEYLNHPQRITTPLKRAGERGENKWTPISWDEALDTVAEKATELQAKYGMDTVVVIQGTGRQAAIFAPPLAFGVFRTSTTLMGISGYSCYGPRCAIAEFVFGTGYPELDFASYFPDSYDHPGYEIPKYIICWGKMPLTSNGDGLFGHAIVDLMKRGSKVVTIDPRITWLGAHADTAIRLRPGTDAALALAMLNIIIDEDLYDHDFVDNWCYGFDELAERCREYPPSKASEITGVPERLIYKVAREFATNKPSSLLWGLTFDQTTTGGQAGHAALAMLAICGYVDVPGGVTVGQPSSFLGKWRVDTRSNLAPGQFEDRIGAKQFPAAARSQWVCNPDLTLECLETDEPKQLRMAFLQSTNIISATNNVQPQRWYEALKKMEFVVVRDLFMTPTAVALADIFLPVATFPELDGVVLPHYGRNPFFVGAINKAIDNPGVKSDLEICLELGKRLNPEAWQYEDAADFYDKQLRASYDFGFDELRKMGVYQGGYTYQKHAKGMLRGDEQPGFNTPSGKIELSSLLFPVWGEDPLPYYHEPYFSPLSHPELAEEYPLILTTGGRKYTSFHSEHRQIDTLREIDPVAKVTINPIDAEKYGIANGDWVTIENWLGKCQMKAWVTDVILPGVVHCEHGWWYPEQEGAEPNLFGVWKSNVNMLLPHFCVNPLGFGSIYKEMMCKIYKAQGLDG